MRTKLKEFRKKEKLTQVALAKKLGISESHYRNVEMGIYDPSYSILEEFEKNFPKAKDIWGIFKNFDA